MENADDVIHQKYRHPDVVKKYAGHAKEIGLWESEKALYPRYLGDGRVLDIGCGAGRVTFPLGEMGYDVTGLDSSQPMIDYCREEAAKRGAAIPFFCADAADMPFEDGIFSACIFSYNGLMTIPGRERRRAVLREIRRVMAEDGVFLFATHLRSSETKSAFTDYWEEERLAWERGEQDPRLVDFGDVIFPAMNNREVEGFVHIPTPEEVEEDLELAGLQVIFSQAREQIAEETRLVKKVTNECVFWVARPTDPAHPADEEMERRIPR